jgi:wyosine [tRNA(Phe)-imidazoG37] synthetase (radical SAM superfamily)
MDKRVFGPVPTRRLGQSLGIDPVPLKTCNWNCVYCQLGRSQPVTNVRKEYFDPDDILSQVQEALNAHAAGKIDWITFVGSGETCLHEGIGELIRGIKSMTDLPVAVITNGSLLYLPEVRAALLPADAILPSLDAGNAHLYRRINRAHPELSFERLVDGLIRFRQEYAGRLWVEVMLVKGLNESEEALKEIASVLTQINPDEVHIVTPTRPPVETWVEAPDEDGLLRARAILGNVAEIVHPATGAFDFSGAENLVDAIVSIITRHPMRESELKEALSSWPADEIRWTLEQLEHSGRAQIVERHGTRFWRAAGTYFPDHDRD